MRFTTCLPRLPQVKDESLEINMKFNLSPLPLQGLTLHFIFFPAECSFSRGTLTTFNKRRHNIPTFLSCPQILAQDCTDELKFIVLLKKDEGEQPSVNVKIARE